MATILTFPIAAPRERGLSSAARSASIAVSTTAEIVIFPGIRYEYHEPAVAKPKAARAKRDLLKIES